MVSALPKDENGFRGAVLLAPGRFVCERTIQITADGVVCVVPEVTQVEVPLL